MGMILIFFITIIFLLPTTVLSTTLTTSCSSVSTVNTVIGTAVSGDVVQCDPASQSATWTGETVSIPNTKGITLDGNGWTITGGTVNLSPHSTVSSRITGFTFTGGANTMNITSGDLTTAKWRVDHNTFTGNGHQIVDFGTAPGLFDHNTFTALQGAQEFIHNEAYGAGDSTGWGNSFTPGDTSMVYLEDNTFTTPTSEANNAWIQSYYGARMVHRFNTFNYVRVDAHGTAGNVGARWWEFYHNAFVQSGGNAGGSVMNLRAGSGIVFSNTKSGAQLTGAIGMCEEDSGYPALYQIGRGQDQALYPAYAWSNQMAVAVNACEAPAQSGMVAFNRDVYTAEDSASCTSGGSCTAGVGIGTTLPTSCTINTGFWKTNEGEWWAANAGADGVLYKCTSTDTWTLFYTPFIYPYPLTAEGLPDPSGAGNASPAVNITAPTSSATYTTAITPLTTLAGTSSDSDGTVSSVTWSCDVCGSGTATGTTSWSVSSINLQLGPNIITVTATDNESATGMDQITITLTDDDIIADNRRIVWDAGVRGGIPTRNTLCATLSSIDGGTSDDQPQIQSALDGCGSGEVVQLNAGTYRLNSQLSIVSDITLRGAGIASTTLNTYAAWHGIQMGSFPATPVTTSVSGSPAKGSTTITVGSITTPSLSVNDYIVIDQINDGVEVVNTDEGCRASGTRCLSQIAKITAIDTLTLTIDPPLMHTYSSAQTPQVWKLGQTNGMTLNASVEDLKIERISPTGFEGYSNFKLVACASCWIKNVESKLAQFRHVDMDRSIWITVRDSFFNDGQHHDTGGFAYGVVSGFNATANLVENNIFYHLRHSMVAKEASAGNVYLYNYSVASWQGDTWLAADLNFHGAHTHMNLFEGNIVDKIYADFTHGSSSYNTIFRNWSIRDSSATTVVGAPRAVDLEEQSWYYNVVGNVLGQASQGWDAFEAPTTRNTNGRYVYSFGFGSDGDTTQDDTNVKATLLRHGNWDYQSGSQQWCDTDGGPGCQGGSESHTLPNSLYYESKPSWYGGCVWPPINPTTPTINDIPAKLRYESSNCPTGIAFLTDPTGLNLTANSTPTFLSNPTGLSLNANATPTFLGNPSGLGLSGNSTPTFLSNPTGVSVTQP